MSELVITTIRKSKEFLYEIRWIMEYYSGKKISGIWTCCLSTPSNRSRSQPTEGLKSVGVELQNRRTQEIFVAKRYPADAWKEFRVIVTASVSMPSLIKRKSFKLSPTLEGITFVSKQHFSETVFIDGSVESKNLNSNNEVFK